VGLALVLTVIAILGLTWIAGRIYSNSVLRLGARVRFLDALRGSSGPQPSSSRRT
jgi:ABC-2 type transport system permease protein